MNPIKKAGESIVVGCALSLLALYTGVTYPGPQDKCQLTETQESILSLVGQYGQPKHLEETAKLFGQFHAEIHSIAQEGDPNIPDMPLNKDIVSRCHRSLAKLGMEGMAKVFEEIADKLAVLGQELEGTPAGQELLVISQDIKDMVGIFQDHLEKYPKSALWTLQMNELKNRLTPYKYLMPLSLERPGQTNGQLKEFWSKIIKKLCPNLK